MHPAIWGKFAEFTGQQGHEVIGAISVVTSADRPITGGFKKKYIVKIHNAVNCCGCGTNVCIGCSISSIGDQRKKWLDLLHEHWTPS